jgi:hypothetical protein
MSLADDLNAGIARTAGAPTCKVCDLLESWGPADVEAVALRKALSTTMGAEQLAYILRRHGYAVGRPSITRHRREGHE